MNSLPCPTNNLHYRPNNLLSLVLSHHYLRAELCHYLVQHHGARHTPLHHPHPARIPVQTPPWQQNQASHQSTLLSHTSCLNPNKAARGIRRPPSTPGQDGSHRRITSTPSITSTKPTGQRGRKGCSLTSGSGSRRGKLSGRRGRGRRWRVGRMTGGRTS